jgi:hypothetical protein
MANTSGSAYFGVESSTGSTIIIGASAYDTSIAGKTALSFSADNGASLGMRFSSTGLAVTGAVSATTTGKVGTTLGVGNATPSASGAGITFPATQSASTDPNTLDDYEEGTWTPVYQGIGGTAGTAASTASGTYTKVGREVICKGKLVLTDKGSWTSAVRFEGLPFSTAITQECTGTMTLGNVSYDGSSFAVYVIAGSTNFYVDVSKTAVDRAVLSTSQVAANSSFFFAFTYIQS